MTHIKTVSTLDLVECLSIAMDLVNPAVSNHQRRVGYIAYQLAREIGINGDELCDILIAGLLHDCGALSMRKRELTLAFDYDDARDSSFNHAEAGYQLLKKFRPFSRVARYVRHHHPFSGRETETAVFHHDIFNSHIIHLADRVDALIIKGENVLLQTQGIVSKITSKKAVLFAPSLVEAFAGLAAKESFWLDIENLNTGAIFSCSTGFGSLKLDADNMLNMVALFGHIIDFRSRFTATHSCGVAACAESLGRLADFSENDCFSLKMAGHLHDLGKLVVPKEILEKPGRLTEDEYAIIRTHSYYTYKILKKFRDLDTVSQWAAYHHERLDGKGYPFHLGEDEIPMGARVMGVADVFTAITEDRPYRLGMDTKESVKVLTKMARNKALDADIVDLLTKNIDEVVQTLKATQEKALLEYQEFEASLSSQ